MRWWRRLVAWLDANAASSARARADQEAMYQASVDALATMMKHDARQQVARDRTVTPFRRSTRIH